MAKLQKVVKTLAETTARFGVTAKDAAESFKIALSVFKK